MPMRTNVSTDRRRSVEFATITEEPEFEASFQSVQSGGLESVQSRGRSDDDGSDASITVDDLDPMSRPRGVSYLKNDFPVDRGHHSTAGTGRRTSVPTGLGSALRRFSVTRLFSSLSDTANDRGERRNPRPPPPNASRPSLVREQATSRRATIFTRQNRSSATASSGSDVGQDGGNPGEGCLPDAGMRALRRLVRHRAWTATTLSSILVLLFGPPVEDLWLPPAADVAMDAVLAVCFLVLACDIVVRCIVDKSYFARDREGRWWSCCSRLSPLRFCNWHAGSHMFWLDTMALLTIGQKISYINPLLRTPLHKIVMLNELGFPTTGHHATPLSIDWQLMLSVGRVGLMARFIRTSVVDQISSKGYWLRFFLPKYWMQKLPFGWCKCKIGKKGAKDNKTGMSERPQVGNSIKGKSEWKPECFSASENDGQLEPCAEEPEWLPPVKKSGPTTVRGFFRGLGKQTSDEASDSLDGASPKARTESVLFNDAKDSRSHVGAAMRELTGQRVATAALLALLMTVICDWHEEDTTKAMTMITLHGQTASSKFAKMSVDIARSSVIPSLYNYTRANKTDTIFTAVYGDGNHLRERDILIVDVHRKDQDAFSRGTFDNSQSFRDHAKVELVDTILILLIWVLGVASFTGPVMTLVVEPIERMVRLLSMLMKDPLGYQNTPQYHRLNHEGDEVADKYKSMWPKEVLEGMETNFLMDTILRIGRLMRVGFGSAGAEIIRNNLERDRHKDVLFLSKQGGSVSCIFLFCDIRQFTDATECLQEEVFVFTNKIAAVVHSICHSYGGSANKNIGDAFLLSWLLDEAPVGKEEKEDDQFGTSERMSGSSAGNLNCNGLYAKNNQAAKALLSVVKISMALHYDNYFVDGMDETPRNRLLTKLSKRKGPIVQMGFGLHAGKAVQGAIGSQRKLDATYISESVERSEFLESSTKLYGVPLLMSDAFYSLLDQSNRRRCRKVDQLIMLTEEEEEYDVDPIELLDCGEKMSIYTFDMDIDALWRPTGADDDNSGSAISDIIQDMAQHQLQRQTVGPGVTMSKRRSTLARRASFTAKEMPSLPNSMRNVSGRRTSLINKDPSRSLSEIEKAIQAATEDQQYENKGTLVLPTGVRRYHERVWLESDIRKIRRDYVSNGIIFPKYQEGLKSYCAKDWANARQCFEFVLSQREDGPSRCFLGRIAEHDGVPPRNFIGYTRSDDM